MKSEQLKIKPVKQAVNKVTYKVGKGTKVKGPSETIQNEALSVSDLLMKHIHGGVVGMKEGQFGTDDPEHDDPDVQAYFQMDLAERQDVLEGIREMTKRLKNLEKEWIEEDRSRKNLEKEGKKPSGSVPSGGEAEG